jgi:hypothetical protein
MGASSLRQRFTAEDDAWESENGGVLCGDYREK